MNRKKKILFIGILAIVYLIIAVNFHKIRFAISMLRLYNQEKKAESTLDNNDNNLKPIVNNPLEKILDSVDIVDNTEDKQNNQETTVDNSTTDKVENVEKDKDISNQENATDKTNDDKDNDNKEQVPDIKESYVSIINEYNIILEDLRATFESELDDLIKEGIEEYSKGELTNTQLASKYLSIGANLEKSSDARFSKVIKDMEKELKANGHDTSVIKAIRDYYTSFKDAKKTDLIDRGMKHVK